MDQGSQLEVLPSSWGQIAFMAALLLLLELRHYLPLFRRWFAAKVAHAERELLKGTDDGEEDD